jgi:hypothetical protein
MTFYDSWFSIQVIFRLLPLQFGRLQCWYYWCRDLWSTPFKWPQVAWCTWRFMEISFGIQAVLRLLAQQFERLQCCYYWWEGFVKYASGAVINIQSFIKIGSDIQKLLWKDTHAHTETQKTARWSHKHTFFFQNKGSRLKKQHQKCWRFFNISQASQLYFLFFNGLLCIFLY